MILVTKFALKMFIFVIIYSFPCIIYYILINSIKEEIQEKFVPGHLLCVDKSGDQKYYIAPGSDSLLLPRSPDTVN